MLGLLDFQEYAGVPVAQIFPLRALVSLLFSPAVIATLVSWLV